MKENHAVRSTLIVAFLLVTTTSCIEKSRKIEAPCKREGSRKIISLLNDRASVSEVVSALSSRNIYYMETPSEVGKNNDPGRVLISAVVSGPFHVMISENDEVDISFQRDRIIGWRCSVSYTGP